MDTTTDAEPYTSESSTSQIGTSIVNIRRVFLQLRLANATTTSTASNLVNNGSVGETVGIIIALLVMVLLFFCCCCFCRECSKRFCNRFCCNCDIHCVECCYNSCGVDCLCYAHDDGCGDSCARLCLNKCCSGNNRLHITQAWA
jgi:hypothetical protein